MRGIGDTSSIRPPGWEYCSRICIGFVGMRRALTPRGAKRRPRVERSVDPAWSEASTPRGAKRPGSAKDPPRVERSVELAAAIIRRGVRSSFVARTADLAGVHGMQVQGH